MIPRLTHCVFVALVAVSVSAHAEPGDYQVRVGDYHPDLTLPSIEDGKPISLSDFRGKRTLLIHFASW